MTLEQQVTSLDLSKRLKELGVKQESVCWWCERYQLIEKEKKHIGVRFNTNPDFSGTYYSYHHEQDICSAFTVAELGELLLSQIVNYEYRTREGKYRVWWYGSPKSMIEQQMHHIDADTEADARAKMLCYLLENKLITI